MALGTLALTAGAAAYALSGSLSAGNFWSISRIAAAGISHNTGKLLGVALLAQRMNPSQILGSIFHTCRLASVRNRPSVNSLSVGAAASA